MKIFLNGQAVEQPPQHPQTGDDLVYFISDSEWDVAKAQGVPGVAVLENMIVHDDGFTRFESHENYDAMCIMVPDLAAIENPFRRILLYVAAGRATFICREPVLPDDFADPAVGTAYLSAEIPCLFLNMLMRRDTVALEDIEEEIADLEDLVSHDLSKDIPGKISALRRRLLKLKKYYDALFALLEDMEENTNELLSEKQLRALHIQTNKADRLSHTVQTLRDYLTQVRESYQAQMDIELNGVMKIFTVITAVFLPLTLLVGWYGMNLKMPEIAYAWMYPVVILLSIAIIVSSIAFFKFKKWF